jgi:hypothetical protein
MPLNFIEFKDKTITSFIDSGAKISSSQNGDIFTVKINGVEMFMKFFQKINIIGMTLEDCFCYYEQDDKGRSILKTHLLERFIKTICH